MNGISIIICCFNSSARISETLRNIGLQKVSSFIPWEVILVNNNSTDNTKEVALREWNKYNLNIPFLIVDENESGLSAARVKGIETSRYDYVIFCDDDNWLQENYVQRAFEIIHKNTNIGVLGGKNESLCEKTAPDWFEKYKHSYAVGSQGTSDGDVTNRGYIWGAGMVIRKNILMKIKSLNLKTGLTGRNRTKLSAGEDSELCICSILIGYKLWYSSELSLIHFIPSNRLNWRYLIEITKGFGESEIGLGPLKSILTINQKKDFNKYKFSWQKESLRIILSWIRHPRMVIRGSLGREGEYSVLWLNYTYSYLCELINKRSEVNEVFKNNFNALSNK